MGQNGEDVLEARNGWGGPQEEEQSTEDREGDDPDSRTLGDGVDVRSRDEPLRVVVHGDADEDQAQGVDDHLGDEEFHVPALGGL